jgi:hypothetical protein
LNGDWSEADAQGRVALPGPWPPDTTLAVGAPGHATRVAPRTPGADEVTITLTPTGGRPTAAPPPTRRVALTGLVTSPAGTPLPGLRVSLHGEAVGATLPVQTDAAGRYELLADLVEGAATATLLTIDPAGAWLGALPDAPVAAAGPDADATRTLPVLEALATSHPVTVAVQGPGSLPSPRTVVTVSLAGARAVELPGTTGARLAPLPGARFGVRARAVSADGLTASHLAQDNLPVDWSAVGTTWQATLLEPPEPDAVPAWASGQVLQCQPVAGARAYAAMLEAGAPHAGLPWLATGVMPSLPLLGLPAALPATDMRASLLAWDGVGEVADLDPTTPTGPASARVRWSVRRWVVPAGP